MGVEDDVKDINGKLSSMDKSLAILANGFKDWKEYSNRTHKRLWVVVLCGLSLTIAAATVSLGMSWHSVCLATKAAIGDRPAEDYSGWLLDE